MFTGIIEGMGTIRNIRRGPQGAVMEVEAGFELSGTKIGDSIATSGACLTVTKLTGRRFTVDISPETLTKTTFSNARIGDRVNLERALRLSDRLDGHLVSGHIDGKGTIRKVTETGNAIIVEIQVPEHLARYMIQKGSVAVDGISLTINHCDRQGFDVSIIPHTAKLTTIGFKQPGDAVNIETDMIGKYVERFVSGKWANEAEPEPSGIDREFLLKTGFL